MNEQTTDSWQLGAGLAVCLVLGFTSPIGAQSIVSEFDDAPRADVLLLGTFHFTDPGLDSFRPEHDIDVFSARRQAEIRLVVSDLVAFRPTKVAVEALPGRQKALDTAFRDYRTGEHELAASEVEQLGFRVAAALGHDRVFAIDAKRRFYEPWVDPDEYAAAQGQTEVLEDPWPARYERLYRELDRLKLERSLSDHLLYLNRERSVLRSHGRYLVESFNAGVGDDYPGVDSKTAWFNRNLRIFANLKRIHDGPEDRLLVIIGSGHLALLRHCVEASPEMELVEVAKVLGKSSPRPPTE